ncbi:hypothetical protein LCGC14_2253750 [marine sediment metagenome]|uniref:Uncharacterized protein n=1 Tax=marine sediment metagenome TaxID=412755 RepID=A0A0F9FE92_9ZZZZ
MSTSIIALCPACKHKFLFESKAKRPRPHCPECHKWFYTPKTNTQNTQKPDIPKPNIVEKKIKELTKELSYTKINEATIEKSLLDLVNIGTIDNGLVRCMIDFFVKIKGKADEVEENIDMEALKAIGVNIKNSN